MDEEQVKELTDKIISEIVITLAPNEVRVTDLRIEPLHSITEEDARLEGVDPIAVSILGQPPELSHKYEYEVMWNSLYAKRGRGWDANPLVGRIAFERTEGVV